MNKENAVNMLSSLKNCSMMIHIGSTSGGINYINANISVNQAVINFDNYGITIKDEMNDGTEFTIPYVKLIDIELSELDTTILTYRYETVEIEIEF